MLFDANFSLLFGPRVYANVAIRRLSGKRQQMRCEIKTDKGGLSLKKRNASRCQVG